MDRVFGIRLGAVIFACFVFAGQVELNIILEREEMLGLKERWGNSSFAWTHGESYLKIFLQLVFATGAYMNLFWLMEAGRFIFGMGGENLQVAQNAYAVGWFKGKELNMVFGLQLSMARIGM